SPWETDGLEAQEVGKFMARFAIGSLTTMADRNPRRRINGTLPSLGYKLEIDWKTLIALAVCIIGMHCSLMGLSIWISRAIVIPSDSNFVTARLLHGLVAKLGDHGSMLDDKELAEAIEQEFDEDIDGNGTIGYGEREGTAKPFMSIGQGVVRRKNLDQRKFPAGLYA
ncbi:MAG: hypothetical protein Q9183_003578, partial [Haloplaca sp. 2 TL-2023]